MSYLCAGGFRLLFNLTSYLTSCLILPEVKATVEQVSAKLGPAEEMPAFTGKIFFKERPWRIFFFFLWLLKCLAKTGLQILFYSVRFVYKIPCTGSYHHLVMCFPSSSSVLGSCEAFLCWDLAQGSRPWGSQTLRGVTEEAGIRS